MFLATLILKHTVCVVQLYILPIHSASLDMQDFNSILARLREVEKTSYLYAKCREKPKKSYFIITCFYTSRYVFQINNFIFQRFVVNCTVLPERRAKRKRELRSFY